MAAPRTHPLRDPPSLRAPWPSELFAPQSFQAPSLGRRELHPGALPPLHSVVGTSHHTASFPRADQFLPKAELGPGQLGKQGTLTPAWGPCPTPEAPGLA